MTANADGSWNSQIQYTAFGEIRSKSGVTPSDYRYTGQLSQMDEIGLLFYVSRFYDPEINQFNQPDSLIPDSYNSLDWNRYSYARYNPIRYSDPSGHRVAEPDGPHEKRKPFVISFQTQDSSLSWSQSEKETINDAALVLGQKFAQIINYDSFLDYKTGMIDDRPTHVSAADAFTGVFGGSVTFKKGLPDMRGISCVTSQSSRRG